MARDDDERGAELAGAIAHWLDRLASASGIADKRYARAALERALTRADPGELTDADAARARALGVTREAIDAASRHPPPHAVRVPLVAEDGTVLVRSFEVAFEPVEERKVLGDEADAAAREAIARAAAQLTARPDSRRYRFVPSSPAALGAAWIDGRSLGAAAFVSALSLFSDRPVRDRAVITGALEGDRVTSVGSVRSKAEAARALGATRVVVPSADAAEAPFAIGVATLDALADACLEPQVAASDPDALVELAARAARDGWSGYRWRSVRERVTRALAIVPEGRPELRVDALAQLAAASRHLGDLIGSAEAIELALAIVASAAGRRGVPDEVLCRLERQRAMHERGRGRLGVAARAAKRAVAIARRARLRGELLKSLGTEGLVTMARGDDAGALAPLEEALAITIERTPREAARSRAYLVEALGRLGRLDEARAHAEAALAECAEQGERGRAKEAWVRTSLGLALAWNERWDETRAALDRPAVHEAIARDPLPGLVARRWLGVALARLGDVARAASLLGASAYAYGDALEPSLRFVADVNLLHELAERAARGDLDVDTVRATLERIASFEIAAVRLGRRMRSVSRALGGAETRQGLHALAVELGRLA